MIVSRKEAEDRILSGRNIFRPQDAPLPSSDQDQAEVEKESSDAEESAVDSPSEVTNPSRDSLKTTGLTLDLSSLDKLLEHKGRYRGQLDNQVGIAETASIIGRSASEDIFGLSNSQIAAYDRGLQSTNTSPNTNPELTRRVAVAKERIAELAVGKLGDALELLTTDKLKVIKKATTLTRVGKDLAVIVDKVTPRVEEEKGNHVHFHVYRPPTLDASAYKKVTIGSAPSDLISPLKSSSSNSPDIIDVEKAS